MKKKIERKFFVFDITPSEFAVLNCLVKREYLTSALSVLGNSFEILYIAKGHFL